VYLTSLSSSDDRCFGVAGVAVIESYRKVAKPKARLACFPYLSGEPSDHVPARR
jgi:hypothetical protein